MPKYRTKPVVIEAVQWTGKNTTDVKQFVSSESNPDLFVTKKSTPAWMWNSQIADENWDGNIQAAIYDVLHQTYVGVRLDDFIIRGTKGEHYPCDPEVFHQKYKKED